MRLTIKQTRALDILEDQVTTELLYGGGAGGGKSALGCYWLLKNCLRYPGTRWLMGRSKLKSLKETTLNTFFEICKLQGVSTAVYRYNQQDNIIYFTNGSQIILKDLFLYPSDPNFDSLGSLEITGGFVDECNQIVQKAWQIVKSRIRYKLDEFGLIPKLMGSCNPAKTWVYTYFYKPAKEKLLEPFKKFVQSLLSDNPYVSKHYRENLLTLDKASKERLLFGNWEYENDPAKLMDYEKIIDCFTNDFVLPGKKYITGDIARFGADSSVLLLWSGFRVVSIQVLKGASVPEVADAVRQMAKQHSVPLSQIVVDEDGVGGGVKDILKCKGFLNGSKALKGENYVNLKSQCYYKLAERVQRSEVFVECPDPAIREKLIEEMEQVKQYKMDKDTKKAVMPKDKVKEILGRSPDISDALMMREYFELTTSSFGYA
ncbi:terminase large subunit domain-containing protein [Rufibacter soli]